MNVVINFLPHKFSGHVQNDRPTFDLSAVKRPRNVFSNCCGRAELLKTCTSDLYKFTLVNALQVAESRGIKIKQSYDNNGKDWRSMINIVVTSSGDRVRNVSGTLFTGKEPRIVNIEGVPVEVKLADNMLFIRNDDKPGLIGGLGTILSNAGQNISDFRLGRQESSDVAICLVSLDKPLSDDLFSEVANLEQIRSIKRLSF